MNSKNLLSRTISLVLLMPGDIQYVLSGAVLEFGLE